MQAIGVKESKDFSTTARLDGRFRSWATCEGHVPSQGFPQRRPCIDGRASGPYLRIHFFIPLTRCDLVHRGHRCNCKRPTIYKAGSHGTEYLLDKRLDDKGQTSAKASHDFHS
jgi:hypothetical protein